MPANYILTESSLHPNLASTCNEKWVSSNNYLTQTTPRQYNTEYVEHSTPAKSSFMLKTEMRTKQKKILSPKHKKTDLIDTKIVRRK